MMMLLAWAAESEARIVYHLGRLDRMDEWWHWLALLSILTLITSYVAFWYRKDWNELPRPLGWTLLVLRIFAYLGVLLFFLDLQKRTEQKVTRSSRVAVLVDTSLSMSLPVDPSSETLDRRSRIASLVESITKSEWLQQFQRVHDTTVYRFDQLSRPQSIASFSKLADSVDKSNNLSSPQDSEWRLASTVAWFGTGLAGIGLSLVLFGLFARLLGNGNASIAYLLLAGTVMTMASLIVVSTAALRASDYPFWSLWAKAPSDRLSNQRPLDVGSQEKEVQDVRNIRWGEALAATGAETRIGDALKTILESERGTPLAGIVLVTDGQSTAGVDPLGSLPDAIAQRVQIHAVGLGSSKSPSNARMVDIEAPKRVFPGDRFRITALVQSFGLRGKQATIQLRSSPAVPGNPSSQKYTIEEEQTIDLREDEEMVPINFEVMPKEVGEWIYDVKLIPPSDDATPSDNSLDTQVRVVLPKFRVLTIAGGPTREYQFVRNLLFRDATIQSHVFLQTGGPGTSQEAMQLLTDFPKTLQEMSEYDCVLAFDADWMKLKQEQVEVLEEWVSRQAGGLVMIAGPVATPRWTGSEGNGDRRAELLRGLAPVELNARGTRLLSMGRFEGTTAWPLKFTVDGLRADFLSIGISPEDTRTAWSEFAGVYSFYACFDPKPGAMTLAEFSDPTTASEGKLPIFLASHFFGAGRVVFQGSGEFWRIREQGVHYFDSYYTKLVRWVGQGRLLRDSDRGMLLIGAEEANVGEQITLRAVLKDAQFQPLMVNQVEARLIDPQSRSTPLPLVPLQDPTQPGVYVGQFLANQVGTFQVQLSIGGLADQEVLAEQVVVRLPTKEIQRPQRNDPLLLELTSKTGGKFYSGIDEAMTIFDSSENVPLCNLVKGISPQDQVNYLSGSPDREFQKRLMGTLMAWIGLALSLEWLIRRLSKLA